MIQSSETIGKISAALAQAQQAGGKVARSGRVEGQRGFDYSTIEDYMEVVLPIMKSNGLSVLTSFDNVESLGAFDTSNGYRMNRVVVTGSMRLVHTSGEWIEVGIAGERADSMDNATAKAMTTARRRGLECLFSLVSDEGEAPPQQQAGAAGQRAPFNPAAAPAAGPSAAASPPSGSNGVATVTVATVELKSSGENARGAWGLYVIKTMEGAEFTLMDNDDCPMAQLASEAASNKAPVDIEWVLENYRGRDQHKVKSIAWAEGAPTASVGAEQYDEGDIPI